MKPIPESLTPTPLPRRNRQFTGILHVLGWFFSVLLRSRRHPSPERTFRHQRSEPQSQPDFRLKNCHHAISPRRLACAGMSTESDDRSVCRRPATTLPTSRSSTVALHSSTPSAPLQELFASWSVTSRQHPIAVQFDLHNGIGASNGISVVMTDALPKRSTLIARPVSSSARPRSHWSFPISARRPRTVRPIDKGCLPVCHPSLRGFVGNQVERLLTEQHARQPYPVLPELRRASSENQNTVA